MPLKTKKNMGLPTLDENSFEEISSLPALDDDVFTVANEEDFEDEEVFEESLPTLEDKQDNFPSKPLDGPILDEVEETLYVDTTEKKVIPLGGKKSKVTAKDFDTRKNRLTSVKIFRLIVMILLVGLFALGIKNTFWPEMNYTPQEVEQMVWEAMGQTGFPMDRGRAFAQSFLKYTISADSKELLQVFNGNTQTTKLTAQGNVQTVVGEPILVQEIALSEYSAFYEFTVLMTDTEGNTSISTANGTKNVAHWLSFSVNVYYDKETGTFTAHKDSPTLIPNTKIQSARQLPMELPLGNGKLDQDISKLVPTIDGFITAYANVSVNSHNEIDQYIPATHDIHLVSGFGGEVKLVSTPQQSIQKVAYFTDNENEWKVDVTVHWKSTQTAGESNTFVGRYVMTIQKTQDDKYLVVKFAPYLYFVQ